MHFIQKHIIDELRKVESKHYAQINSDGIESGHFRYHLNELVKAGLVEQVERGVYRLSADGQRLADKLSDNRVVPHAMPKVITYTLLLDGDIVLLQKKSKQPYMNLFNMIGGKLHEGETSEQAAIREVKEKTGQIISPPQLAGIFEIRITSQNELLTHVVAYVFKARVQADDFTSDSVKTFRADEVNKAKGLAPDFLPIYELITDSTDIQIEALDILIKKN
jgi:ADP-ribose pyrophosphatase YjhB (NUDIX family)